MGLQLQPGRVVGVDDGRAVADGCAVPIDRALLPDQLGMAPVDVQVHRTSPFGRTLLVCDRFFFPVAPMTRAFATLQTSFA